MRRADRLFQIIQMLRRSRGPLTAAAIASELEVSTRTVYRDVADLISWRVPVVGEAGFGYLLETGYDMPALMLTPDEIEAATLGAQLVARLPDARLARSARDLVAKIHSAVPEGLRSLITEPTVGAKPGVDAPAETADMGPLRAAIRDARKIRLRYRAETGDETDRTVWPVVLGYDERHCMLIAWCELRQAFRHFRTDRIVEVELLREGIGLRRSDLLRRWERWREAQLRRSEAG